MVLNTLILLQADKEVKRSSFEHSRSRKVRNTAHGNHNQITSHGNHNQITMV